MELLSLNNLGASKIIDLATLTGAIVAALGSETTGAFTNNDAFFADFQKAADSTNEYIWQMPLFPRDQKSLRNSDVADLNNAPVGKTRCYHGCCLLKEFVEDTPWIHLDIAGTADAKAAHDLGPKGGTGVMVRTIARLFRTTSLMTNKKGYRLTISFFLFFIIIFYL